MLNAETTKVLCQALNAARGSLRLAAAKAESAATAAAEAAREHADALRKVEALENTLADHGDPNAMDGL